jgi:hypothetical protein
MTDSCFHEDSEELGQRIRALFQDRGYFTVEVRSVRIKPLMCLVFPNQSLWKRMLQKVSATNLHR